MNLQLLLKVLSEKYPIIITPINLIKYWTVLRISEYWVQLKPRSNNLTYHLVRNIWLI